MIYKNDFPFVGHQFAFMAADHKFRMYLLVGDIASKNPEGLVRFHLTLLNKIGHATRSPAIAKEMFKRPQEFVRGDEMQGLFEVRLNSNETGNS